jgi:MFS family permease
MLSRLGRSGSSVSFATCYPANWLRHSRSRDHANPTRGQELERSNSRAHEIERSHTRLVPQPSADPADPLNWSSARKYGVLFAMSLWAFTSNFQSASLSSAFPQMVMAFPLEGPLSFPDLTHTAAVNLLMLGASSIWWVPLANTYGRRPMVLLGLVMLLAFSIWAASARTFSSLLAARLFMGAACGTAETIAPDVVGEVFFVHQRGRAMGVYTVFLAMGPLVGGTAGSYIAADRGWRWVQWICAMLAGLTLFVCLFLQPETLFDRRQAMEVGSVVPEFVDEHCMLARLQMSHKEVCSSHSSAVQTPNHSVSQTYNPPCSSPLHKPQHHYPDQVFASYTLTRSLKIGGMNRGHLLRRFISQFLTLHLPGVWMVILQYAGLVAGIVTVSIVGSNLVASPPYLWGSQAGLINMGGIIGTFLGAAYTYLLSDRSLTSSARHDRAHGFAEPEQRLWTQFPALVIATFGLWIFGAVASNPSSTGWVGLEAGYGLLAFGLMQAPSVGFNYVIESYNAVSSDCLVMITLFRGIISFAWTFFAGQWVQSRGAMEPFGIFGMLMGLFTLLTVPQYFLGKRTRIATARWLPDVPEH